MPTVEEIDERIEEHKRQIARMEERKRAILAKQREQERKWKAMCLSAIGEAVLDAVGCDWNELDVEALSDSLTASGRDMFADAVAEGRSPADAKAALDDFMRLCKTRKQAKASEPEPQDEPTQPDGGEPQQEQSSW